MLSTKPFFGYLVIVLFVICLFNLIVEGFVNDFVVKITDNLYFIEKGTSNKFEVPEGGLSIEVCFCQKAKRFVNPASRKYLHVMKEF